ncbi:MAG: ABC transporter permease [Polyangiaceae bacterium]|jgi:ABC-type dipeptide/oligopeptide/nickel transport system permease component
MFRYAIRQLFWAIPKLFATSLFLFFVTTLAPPARGEQAGAGDALRARFADLPGFINAQPQDVRTRSVESLAHIAGHDAQSDAAAGELCRLGGAALPVVLPSLETLAPEPRGRVATALAPIAERMGFASSERLEHPEAAALFWTRFWEYRRLDFTPNSSARAVDRLVDYGSDLRERDVAVLDTFALAALMRAVDRPLRRDALERVTRLAQHASGRGMALTPDASDAEVRRVVSDWKHWWFAHEADYSSFEGVSRVRAMITETQYGKWLARIADGDLGISSVDGEPIAHKLRARTPVTFLLCGVAALVACLIAIPLGVFRAWRSGSTVDALLGGIFLVVYATPTFAMAEQLRRAAGPGPSAALRTALAVVAVAVASAAVLATWQRAALLEVVRADFIRTAYAQGCSAGRIAIAHALRAALMPVVALAGLLVPSLLGSAFVAEEVFGLRGLGFETMRAVEAHDTAWLMAILIVSAILSTLGLAVSDLLQTALDPRVRDSVAHGRGHAE